LVTSRVPSSEDELFKRKFSDYISRFGRGSVTLTKQTITTNAAGRIKTSTPVTSTISGDLQFISYRERQYLGEGIANIGDGMFFCEASVDIDPNDEITVDSVIWKLTNQIEGELVGNSVIYQGWIAVRKEV